MNKIEVFIQELMDLGVDACRSEMFGGTVYVTYKTSERFVDFDEVLLESDVKEFAVSVALDVRTAHPD